MELYILIGIVNMSYLAIDESIKIGIPFKELKGIFGSPVHIFYQDIRLLDEIMHIENKDVEPFS